MDRINILNIISKSRNYDIALLTTFNFEISFFEKVILNKLYDNGTRKVSLFIDSKEFIKSMENVEYSYVGKRYIVTPVKMNSSFHPKVILLLGKDKARLIVGSWNLNNNAYFIYNEVGNCFDYDDNNTENLSLIQSAINFFIEINERTDKRDNNLIQTIKHYSYYSEKTNNNNSQLLFNLNTSILEQASEFIKESVNEIDIAVPYFYKDLEGLKGIIAKYPNSKIKLYIQNGRNTFPDEFIKDYDVKLYNRFIDNGSYHFYHGKVYRFITNNNSYILYGSANCTSAALIKSTNSGGNVECNIISKGKKDEYNYFFENFFIEEVLEFKSELLEFDNPPKKQYMFINNDYNILKFNYSVKNDSLKIKILENELKYSYVEDYLSVTVPMELYSDLNGIFVVDFLYEDTCEKISCYFNDFLEIERNRNAAIVKKIPDINISPDINAEPDKYLNDRRELISKFSFMYDLFNEKIDYYVEDDETEDSEVTEDKEDFINYDFKLSDEVQVKQKTLDQIFKANRYVYTSFRERLIGLGNRNEQSNGDVTASTEPSTQPPKKREPRKATSSEKSFARFVKSIVKDLLNRTNSNKLDFSNYFQCVVSIFDVYNKFMIREYVTDMFKEEETITAEYELINELTSKFDSIIRDDEKEMYLWLSLACILQVNHINTINENTDYKKNLFNKDFLKKLNEKFNIRSNYKKYLDVALNFINENEEKVDRGVAISYLELLFDYRTKEQIYDLMDKNFGKNYTTYYRDSVLTVRIKTDNIGDYFRLNNMVIKEMIKSYDKKDRVEKIRLIFENININPNFVNPPVRIEYTFNRFGIGQQVIVQKDGNELSKEYIVR